MIHSAGTAHLFCPVAGFSWLCDNCVLNAVSRRSDLRSVFLFNAWVRNQLVKKMMCLCVSVCVLSDVEVDVDELNQEQVMDLNKMATPYGMAEGDFVR